jgi:hypothetical protein
VKHFTLLKWHSDDQVETFKNNWLEVVNLQRNPLSESHLAEMLLELLDHSENMKNDIAEYRRRVATDQTMDRSKDYSYLMNIMSRHIAAQKEKGNNLALCQAIGKSGKFVPLTPVNPGEKAPCKFWAAGTGCKFDKDCKYYHDKKIKQSGGKSGGGKGSPGAKSQARASSPGASYDTPCFKWILGKCDRTAADCKFQHRKCNATEQPAFEKYKLMQKEREAKNKTSVAAAQAENPSAKAEAKSKAKAKAKPGEDK